MQEIFAELTTALRTRLAIISDEEARHDAATHMDRLKRISEEIEEIESRLPSTIDPQLRHFLQRRSYSKALELLCR